VGFLFPWDSGMTVAVPWRGLPDTEGSSSDCFLIPERRMTAEAQKGLAVPKKRKPLKTGNQTAIIDASKNTIRVPSRPGLEMPGAVRTAFRERGMFMPLEGEKSARSLYHYCTGETLKCILGSRTLRLADIRKSNDSKEIEYCIEGYEKYWSNKYGKWLLKNCNSVQSYYKKMAFQAHAKCLDYIVTPKSDFKIELENTVFLVTCFSRKEDDLHMWNCYANKGVCIEFNEDELNKVVNNVKFASKNLPDNKKITYSSGR
jgi:hypothetical protein